MDRRAILRPKSIAPNNPKQIESPNQYFVTPEPIARQNHDTNRFAFPVFLHWFVHPLQVGYYNLMFEIPIDWQRPKSQLFLGL